MNSEVSKLFKQHSLETTAENALCERILERVSRAAAARARLETYLWGTIATVSLAAFLASSVYAIRTFAASSFSSYFSLVFSDGGSIALVWKEFTLSLIESLPIVGIGILLASVYAVLWSIRKFSKHTHTETFIWTQTI